MQRYFKEKQRCQQIAKKYQQLWGHAVEPGHFRKGRRIGGCGNARCQLCHAEKFPHRKPTRQEMKALYEFKYEADQ
jgi:hypothetical protein